jgi:hypothetical protein
LIVYSDGEEEMLGSMGAEGGVEGAGYW